MEKELDTKFVHLKNAEIYAYREAGTSPKVLLILHGAASSSQIFTLFLPPLSETLRVIAVDLRGHGQSSYNSPLASHDDFVEDIKQFIEVLSIKKFYILGWSMGGNIAMKLAAQVPEKIEGLILLNSAGAKGFVVNKVDENGNVTNERAQTKEEVYKNPGPMKLVNSIANQDRETVRVGLKKSFFNGKAVLSSERLEVYVDEWLKCRCADCLPYNSNRYNISNEHSGAAEGTNEISKIKCKTLILHGENDMGVLKKEAEYIKDCLGDLAKIKIFDNAGHIVIEDYPKEVLKLIQEFCS